MRWVFVTVLAGVLADTSPVAAQPCFAPVGWARPSGITFSVSGRHFFLNGGWGGGYWAPPPPIWGFAPPPVWGYAPLWCGPPIVVSPPVVVLRPVQYIEVPQAPPLLPAPQPVPDPLAAAKVNAAVERGQFVMIRPRKPGDAVPPVPLPPMPRVVPVAKGPPADPKLRGAYEIAQAKEAFAAGQYGRAMERLADAVQAEPKNPQPHFLIAQCCVARTEYAEAVTAICNGTTLAPDWPTKVFDLREFYGPTSAAFDDHLSELKAAAKAAPADATLAFLLGYHLWFMGDKEPAERLFRDAVKRVRDTTVIDAFLKTRKP